MDEGLIIVLSGPSGVGKGTMLQLLKNKSENMKVSVSVTTRQPRKKETEGIDYYYKSIPQFEEMIKNNELIEWVKYCENYYGTPAKFIKDSVKGGYDAVFEIEVNGAKSIKEKYPQSITIFVIPPTMEELERRIRQRASETPEVIDMRLKRAREEIKYMNNYEYIVVNYTDAPERAAQDIKNIITAEKLKFKRNLHIAKTFGVKILEVN